MCHSKPNLIAVPADDACSELPPVDNGGIVYSDLSLAPGISARYVCDVGFNLRPFYERYNFTCTEDGIWDGNVTEVPVECQREDLQLRFRCLSRLASFNS